MIIKKIITVFSLTLSLNSSRSPSTLFLSHVSNQKVWYSLKSLPLSYIKPKTHTWQKNRRRKQADPGNSKADPRRQHQDRSDGSNSGRSWGIWLDSELGFLMVWFDFLLILGQFCGGL